MVVLDWSLDWTFVSRLGPFPQQRGGGCSPNVSKRSGYPDRSPTYVEETPQSDSSFDQNGPLLTHTLRFVGSFGALVVLLADENDDDDDSPRLLLGLLRRHEWCSY